MHAVQSRRFRILKIPAGGRGAMKIFAGQGTQRVVHGLANRSVWAAIKGRCALSSFAGDLADECNKHVVHSPFLSIEDGPYISTPELVMERWGLPNDMPKNPRISSDDTAILDGSTGLSRTFGDFVQSTGGLAASLRYELNVQEGDTVCLYSFNHVDYAPITLAVGLCGAKLTPVNPLFTARELQVILEQSGTTVLIAHINNLDTALEAARQCPSIQHVVAIPEFGENMPSGVTSLNDLRNHDKAFYSTIRDSHSDAETHPYLLPYSSGTTGLPKGVCLSHSNMTANLMQIDAIEGAPKSSATRETWISPLPFFHIYGMTFSNLYCAWKGHCLITMSRRFDLETFCQLVQEWQPQRAHVVPPILLRLAQDPLVSNYDMTSVQCLVSAAAPLSHETEKAVQDRLGRGTHKVVVKQAWGMSELSPIGTLNADATPKSASIGPLVPNTQGKIIDEETGASLGPNTPGELVIKGPQVMMGYLNDEGKTRECKSQEGWLRTGDVAYYDEDGFFFVTDRIKEMIKVRGFPVAPAELEALLLTNELVADAAVISMPDEAAGELPRAYIVLTDVNEPLQEEGVKQAIYNWIKERVAPYKRLDGGIVFVDEIPKSASGKILRRILRDQLTAET